MCPGDVWAKVLFALCEGGLSCAGDQVGRVMRRLGVSCWEGLMTLGNPLPWEDGFQPHGSCLLGVASPSPAPEPHCQ